MLSEFYITTDDFEIELKECDKALASVKGLNNVHRLSLADLARDMLSFRDNFLRAHMDATMWVTDSVAEMRRAPSLPTSQHSDFLAYLKGDKDLPDSSREAVQQYIQAGLDHAQRMNRLSKSVAGTRSQNSASELQTAYKAYFFFVRAFHDAAYRVILLLSGQRPGLHSSMHAAVKNTNSPVHAKIATIPGYIEWFTDFRDKRNRIKVGANFSLCGPQWDVGIGFNKTTPEGGIVVDMSEGPNSYRLGDLMIAFRFSAAILVLIRREARGSAS